MRKYILKNAITKISDYIVHNKELVEKDASLIGGTTGIVLFYESAMKINPELEEYFYFFLQETFDNIHLIKNYTYSDGLLGVLYCLNDLSNKDMIDIDENVINEFNNIIQTLINKSAKEKDFELFTGLIGIGLYCLGNTKLQSYLPIILNQIMDISSKDNDGIYWKFHNGNEINFGHAHGNTSIIVFLIHLFKNNIEREKIKGIVEDSLKWLLSKRTHTSIFGFPCIASYPCYETTMNSRLAWCYGDLMIAYTLCLVGIEFQNKEFLDSGVDIARKLSKIEIENSGVKDAMFCHGSSGVLFIFYKINKLHQHSDFQGAINYWLEKTLRDIKNEYRFVLSEGNNQSINILEGVAGIGLVLSSIYNDDSDWDKYFLF